MIFKIDNGDYVNLWSNGVVPGKDLNYGVAVTDKIDALDYVGGVSVSAVPETVTWLMMIVGFGAIGGMMRRVHRKSEEKSTQRVRSVATA
jgi:hypothetical protein